MRLRLSLVAAVVVSAVGGSATFGAVTNAMGVAAPVRPEFGGDVELLGPRSVLVLSVPPAQVTLNAMTAGQPISIGALFGVDEGGSIVTNLVDVSSAIVSPPNYDNTNGSTVTIDLKLVPNFADFFLASNLDGFEPGPFDDVVSVRLRITTADRNLNVDGVQNVFDGSSEDNDTCYAIDQTAPRIVAAYYEHPNFWVEFSELMSSKQPANDANHTVLGQVSGTDFQTSPSSGFTAASTGAGTPFAPLAFVSPNTMQVNVGPAINLNLQPGRFVRCRADDAGAAFNGGSPLHDVRDIAGNVAFQQDVGGLPVTQGVVITAGSPPIFRQWLNPGSGAYLSASSWAPSGVPGLNDTLRIDRPPGVTATVYEADSSSRRLWIGGDVTLELGTGDTQATFLSYTETSEPSLVVGYEQLFGTLSLTNNSTVSTSFVTSEWTHVGGPNAGIAALNVGADTVFRTGKLLVEGPPSTLTVETGGVLVTGFDDGVGGTPPDFETLIGESAAVRVQAGSLWDANGPVVVGNAGTLEVIGDGVAAMRTGFALEAGGSIVTSDLTLGDFFELGVLPGLNADRGLTMDAGGSLSVADTLTVLPGARLNIANYAGQVIATPQNAVLGGSLALAFAPGFDPAEGSSFLMLLPSFTTGRFALHVLPSFPDERVATIEYITPSLGTEAVSVTIQTLPSIIGVDSDGDSTPVQGQPVTAAAGDLNGDGFDDLAVVVPDQNPGLPGSVFVFINNADIVNPGFSSALQLTVGPDPTDVAIGDFDAEGVDIGESDLDLAVSCAGDDSVRIYQNNGTATAFEQVAEIGVPARPWDVDTADFDADGRDDLAVTCRDADVVRILLNNSTPVTTVVGFIAVDDIAAGDEPVDCDPVDLDNDKDIDIVTANFGAGTVSFATNDSGGNFGTAGFAIAGQGPNGVDSGDIDGDGDADVVVADSLDGTVTVMTNSGGVLAPIGSIPVGDDALSIVLIDLDNDDDQDIAVIASEEDTQGAQVRQIRILRNDTVQGGPPTFAAASSLGAGNGPVYILTGDVNNDGRNDLISVDTETTDAAAMFAGAGGSDGPGIQGVAEDGSVTVYLNFTTPSPSCAGDTNLDGKVDGKDVSAVLGKFGQSFPPLTGPNLNGDFVVNSADLSVVLGTFGSVCRE